MPRDLTQAANQYASRFDDEVWETWEADKREKFGARWPEVQAVLAALESAWEYRRAWLFFKIRSTGNHHNDFAAWRNLSPRIVGRTSTTMMWIDRTY